jgi:predicted amidohydrolase YtcJ
MATADLVLTGGKILTLDRHSRIVQALAVRGGRIAALGRESEIAGLVGPDTRCLDLRGRLAVPGLVDGHAHMDREGLKLRWLAITRHRAVHRRYFADRRGRGAPHAAW